MTMAMKLIVGQKPPGSQKIGSNINQQKLRHQKGINRGRAKVQAIF